MVFFDTLHIKEQVMAELFCYWPKIRVGGWAVFHDTEWGDKHDHYLGVDWGQPIEGIDAYFGKDCEHVTRVHYPESHGMTFIQKIHNWNPKVEGMNEALEASKRLTEALCQ